MLPYVNAVNWNRSDDDYSLMFWNQNFQQIWSEEEIDVNADKNAWADLSEQEKEVYKRVLGGLTFLDTRQGGQGMPLISLHTDSEQRKAVLGLMGFMEHVHAKSYSRIFSTLATTEEIDRIFDWTRTNPYLTRKGDLVTERYLKLMDFNVSKKDLYMAIATSVFLESFLFYSGFFLPLYLAGQGKLTASGEIINLIIRDESIHGVYTGLIAQELYNEMTVYERAEIDVQVRDLFEELYDNELKYTHDLYAEIGLEQEVTSFIRYNANKAFMNLGFEPFFPEEAINPIVENGLSTETKNHDFFSTKGNGYVKTLNITTLEDSDFVFDFEEDVFNEDE